MRDYHIAWWNLENLFDEESAVALGRRTDKLLRPIKDDIAGWTPQLRDRKIDQLASVIAQMNAGRGPDLLGVCEVENRFVVERQIEAVNTRLPSPRSYAVVHADTDDARGIDVAFIYDDTLFQVPAPVEESVFFHVVMRRNATREIVQVNFQTTTPAARNWAVFGNHWPSRSGGQFESAGYRAIAGETLGYFHQRVLEVHGPLTPVLALGDLNDEPFDASLVQHAQITRQRAKVTSARESPLLWNLMWPSAGTPDGSFYFDNQPNMLDQFSVFPRPFDDEELRSISVPVLLLVGDRESTFDPHKAVDRARQLLPRVEADVLPGIGHMVAMEAADVVNAQMLRFLGG